jgi:twitching motility protein PilU
MAAIDISPILKFMLEKGGSDLFFSTGTSIHMEIEGDTVLINNQIMAPGLVKEIAYALMTATQVQEFESTLECNFAMSQNHIGRFRVNVFRQRDEVGMVIRHIKTEIPSLEILGLLPILKSGQCRLSQRFITQNPLRRRG